MLEETLTINQSGDSCNMILELYADMYFPGEHIYEPPCRGNPIESQNVLAVPRTDTKLNINYPRAFRRKSGDYFICKKTE